MDNSIQIIVGCISALIIVCSLIVIWRAPYIKFIPEEQQKGDRLLLTIEIIGFMGILILMCILC